MSSWEMSPTLPISDAAIMCVRLISTNVKWLMIAAVRERAGGDLGDGHESRLARVHEALEVGLAVDLHLSRDGVAGGEHDEFARRAFQRAAAGQGAPARCAPDVAAVGRYGGAQARPHIALEFGHGRGRTGVIGAQSRPPSLGRRSTR